jgi:hypothetical protein
MSTTQDPDYKGIAKQMAEGAYPRKMWPEGTLDEVRRQRKGYTSCMEAKLRSDWETIRLLRALPHTDDCNAWDKRDIDTEAGTWEWVTNPTHCTCGLTSHLSTLQAQF